MRTSDVEVLVTGATGFMGRWLVAELTGRGTVVAAVVRGAKKRSAELRRFVDAHGGDGERLAVIEGDVEKEGLGLEVDLPNVEVVHHLAARFAFGLTPSEARIANVEGTMHALAYARSRPRLTRFVFLGGYQMTKVPLDEIPLVFGSSEDALRVPALRAFYARRGAYEASKYESYAQFRRFVEDHGLPWTAVHPSGVIGDSRTGETTQTAGLGETVLRLHARRLPALGGGPETYVPLVTVDYLAKFLATVPERAHALGKDLVVLDGKSPNLPALVRLMAKSLDVPAPKLRVPVGLLRLLPRWMTGLDVESLAFLTEHRFDTREAEAHAQAMNLEHPDLEASVARWCRYLVSDRGAIGSRAHAEPVSPLG